MGKTLQKPAALSSQPRLHLHGKEIQEFGAVRLFPLGLSHDARAYSCQRLNQILADTQILYALYKKHHWLMRGPTFYQLHLLLDKHAGQQLALIDTIAERVQALGGVAVGDPRHAAEITRIRRAPNGCARDDPHRRPRRSGEDRPAGRRWHQRPDRLECDSHWRTAGVVPRGASCRGTLVMPIASISSHGSEIYRRNCRSRVTRSQRGALM
jgi:hypothetical protein